MSSILVALWMLERSELERGVVGAAQWMCPHS